MQGQRTVIAAIVAPLTAPILIGSPSLLLLLIDGASFQSQVPALKLMLGTAAAFSYLGFLVIGVPAIWVLKKCEALTFGTVLAVGVGGGVVIGFIFGFSFLSFLGGLSSSKLGEFWKFGIFGAVLGFGVALCYGLLASIPRRTRTHGGDA